MEEKEKNNTADENMNSKASIERLTTKVIESDKMIYNNPELYSRLKELDYLGEIKSELYPALVEIIDFIKDLNEKAQK